MAYKYKLTENAINDIDGIVNYITYSLCNKEAADSFFSRLSWKYYAYVWFLYGCPEVANRYINHETIKNAL